MTGTRSPEIVLIRHGETEWSSKKRHTGRTDVPLTDQGREQAKRLASPLSKWQFSRVLTSPLRRAHETCELALPEHPHEHREELVEWEYGEYEGLTTHEIREGRPGWYLWTDGARGGESAQQVGLRVDGVVEELRGAGSDIVIFAHGHLLRVLTARWLGLAPSEGRHFALGTGALSVLGYEREAPVIVRWNE